MSSPLSSLRLVMKMATLSSHTLYFILISLPLSRILSTALLLSHALPPVTGFHWCQQIIVTPPLAWHSFIKTLSLSKWIFVPFSVLLSLFGNSNALDSRIVAAESFYVALSFYVSPSHHKQSNHDARNRGNFLCHPKLA